MPDKVKIQLKQSNEIPETSKERNRILDIVRGIGIFFMVAEHAETPFPKNFVSLFHVTVFFMVSGYFWNDKNVASLDASKKYLIKK